VTQPNKPMQTDSYSCRRRRDSACFWLSGAVFGCDGRDWVVVGAELFEEAFDVAGVLGRPFCCGEAGGDGPVVGQGPDGGQVGAVG